MSTFLHLNRPIVALLMDVSIDGRRTLFHFNIFPSFPVNAILTLQLPPHAGQSDQHEAGTAESKSR